VQPADSWWPWGLRRPSELHAGSAASPRSCRHAALAVEAHSPRIRVAAAFTRKATKGARDAEDASHDGRHRLCEGGR
jgi:hypothetical protein